MRSGAITNKPILSKNEDLLKIEKYALALSKFIRTSDTPITIGLQGEWGTGKTSLMALIKEGFDSSDSAIATSWVNTWEYSLFRGAKETTPGVLRGMLEKLNETCNQRGIRTLSEKSTEKFKKATRFLSAIANQVVASQTGFNIKDAISSSEDNEKVIAEVAEIKRLISELIVDLINDQKNPVDRVVFFVDDLDRIPPADAVEVLEALKNIFDIPNCIFILAIDYDVVIKGLESKFGKKTDENEREFRSFFDKIIQVPFSMPIGTYDIDNFLRDKFKDFDISVDDDIDLFNQTVRLTVGYNPRSLKRYLNSFTLINNLRNIELEDNNSSSSSSYMLFALLGLQISFPGLFRIIMSEPNFPNWSKETATKQDLEWGSIEENLKKFNDHELLDEDWERVVYGICLKDPYQKSKVFHALELLNLIKDNFADKLQEELESAITFAAITNVDDNIQSKQEITKVGNKIIYGGLDVKIKELENIGYDEESIKLYTLIWSPINDYCLNNPNYKINFTKSATTLYNLNEKDKKNQQKIFYNNPSKKHKGSKMFIKGELKKLNDFHDKLMSLFPDSSQKDFVKNDEYKVVVVEPSLYSVAGNEYEAFITILMDYLIPKR